MERYQRGKGKKKLLGSHQRCWIWGRHAVTETLEAGRWPILELLLADDLPPACVEEALNAARTRGFPGRVVNPDELSARCRTSEHQGFAAKMAEYPYAGADEILRSLTADALLLALDGIQDPYNLGAMLRSAEVFGVRAVFLPASGQVGVTSMVARSSAGAVNRLDVVRVERLEWMLNELKQRSFRVVGASEKAGTSSDQAAMGPGLVLVIGNEGAGIRPKVLSCCDELVRIPQQGRIGSLNAAVAAAILLYECRREKAPRVS